MISIGSRMYPKWLFIILFIIFIFITLYVPTQVFFRDFKAVQSGPYFALWNIPDRVYLLDGVYYDKEPIDYNFIFEKQEYDHTETRLVVGIDYGRMGLQYLIFILGSATSLLLSSQKGNTDNKDSDNTEKTKEISLYEDLYTPQHVLVINFHLSARIDERKAVEYKEKKEHLMNIIKNQKSFLMITAQTWIVELFEKEMPCMFGLYLMSKLSPDDHVIISGISHTFINCTNEQLQWIEDKMVHYSTKDK